MQLTSTLTSWRRAPKARASRPQSAVAAAMRAGMLLASLLPGVAATAATAPPPAVFVVETTYNLPMNNPNAGHSLEPTFSAGSSGWGLRVSSAITPNSTTTTLDVTNNTCQRSNGVGGGTRVDVYVMGPPGTPYQIQFDWTAGVSANAQRTTALWANTMYSTFGNVSVYVEPGHSDTRNASAQGVDTGLTTGPTRSSGGESYSFAKSYRLSGGAGSNGQCFTCADNCCDCGLGRSTQTLTAEVLLDCAPPEVERLAQRDPRWAGNDYAGRSPNNLDSSGRYTVGELGCNLTALTMLLQAAGASLTPAPDSQPLNPGTLNDWMKKYGGYTTGNLVREDFVTNKLLGPPWRFEAHSGSADPDELRELLCRGGSNGEPVPVMIGVRTNSSACKKQAPDVSCHFVVVTGMDATGRFTIADPASPRDDPSRALKSYLDEYMSPRLRGIVKDPDDFSFLGFYSQDVSLHLRDASGRETRRDQRDIPGSAYSRYALATGGADDPLGESSDVGVPTTDALEVNTPQAGEYTLTVEGERSSLYTVEVSSIVRDGSDTHALVFQGLSAPGQPETFTMTVAEDGTPSSPARVASFESAAAQLQAAADSGLIAPRGIVVALQQSLRRAQDAHDQGDCVGMQQELEHMLGFLEQLAGKHVSEDAAKILTEVVRALYHGAPCSA